MDLACAGVDFGGGGRLGRRPRHIFCSIVKTCVPSPEKTTNFSNENDTF